ncbi:MAG: hypothetical protein EOP06_19170 [Proteobacteria bacterium]|nr:MAG: hypothetical protein EOP06_19170 [Pseudomonadota bacterium]
MVASVFVFLFFAVFTYLGVTKGFSYVKDNFIGHPTKELLEGEWVSSEYGNPAVFIESPKVLVRDDKRQLPKEAMAIVKDMQMFQYGSLTDNFFVIVSTISYKGEQQIDLDKGVEGFLQVMEKQGASNVVVKIDTYDTPEGTSGKKAYGTLVMKGAGGHATKMYYELLAFGQDNGVQMILVAHDEQDQYAKQIRERLLNSVELKKVAL